MALKWFINQTDFLPLNLPNLNLNFKTKFNVFINFNQMKIILNN